MEAHSLRPLLLGLFDMASQLLHIQELAFSKAIRELQLLDARELQRLHQRARAVPDGKDLDLDLGEVLVLYTAADIDCKAYLSDFGDQMRKAQVEINGVPEEKYIAQVYGFLKLVSQLLDELRHDFAGNPAFEEQLERLEGLTPYLTRGQQYR